MSVVIGCPFAWVMMTLRVPSSSSSPFWSPLLLKDPAATVEDPVVSWASSMAASGGCLLAPDPCGDWGRDLGGVARLGRVVLAAAAASGWLGRVGAAAAAAVGSCPDPCRDPCGGGCGRDPFLDTGTAFAPVAAEAACWRAPEPLAAGVPDCRAPDAPLAEVRVFGIVPVAEARVFGIAPVAEFRFPAEIGGELGLIYMEEFSPKDTLALVATSPFPSSIASGAELREAAEELVGCGRA